MISSPWHATSSDFVSEHYFLVLREHLSLPPHRRSRWNNIISFSGDFWHFQESPAVRTSFTSRNTNWIIAKNNITPSDVNESNLPYHCIYYDIPNNIVMYMCSSWLHGVGDGPPLGSILCQCPANTKRILRGPDIQTLLTNHQIPVPGKMSPGL